MRLIATILSEFIGLFVADVRLVAAVVVWTCAVAFALHSGLASAGAAALALALGVAAALLIDVLVAARSRP
jgi:hypothetical protein